jgi:OmpA-OmpF porin, OOP family
MTALTTVAPIQATQADLYRPCSTVGVLNAVALAAALLVLSACSMGGSKVAAADKVDASKLSNTRTQTDKTIQADMDGYKLQQAAIKAQNDTGKHPVKSYSLAKAQCWLDVSLHEYSRNDRSRWPQLAMQESIKITDYLSAGGLVSDEKNPAQQTLLINNAAKLRPDLWATADGLKKQAGFKCAEKQVACAEVELVHAGNEHNQQGWRHAKPYVQIAEDQLTDAQAATQACEPVKATATAPTPAVTPTPAVAVRSVEKITLGASALFRFNKRNLQDLLPEGKVQLDDLARKVSTVYETVEHIELVGYTDRLGSDTYNETLSKDRANTVKAYLQNQGVKAQMTTAGRGKASPVATNCASSNRPTKALTACLQPNRRVEVTIVGVKR